MKKILTVFVFCGFSLFNAAQAQPKGYSHYVGLVAGGGMNTLLYRAADGNCEPGLGFGGGLHYAWFMNKRYGVGFGMHCSQASATAVYDFTETTYGLTHPDNPGVRYDLNSTYDGWRERQTVMCVSLPVEFLWRSMPSRHSMFVVGVGAQFDVPLRGGYVADEGTFRTTGFFPATGHTVGDQPQHGFGSYDADFGGEVAGLKAGVGLIADMGVRLCLGDHWGLYLGLYAHMGLTSCIEGGNDTPLLTIGGDNASPIAYQGTLDSRQTAAMHLAAAGLKMGVDLGWNRLKRPAPDFRNSRRRLPHSRVRYECPRYTDENHFFCRYIFFPYFCTRKK